MSFPVLTYIFAFLRCHTVGIPWCVVLSDWLLSLGDMHLRSCYIGLWLTAHFLPSWVGYIFRFFFNVFSAGGITISSSKEQKWAQRLWVRPTLSFMSSLSCFKNSSQSSRTSQMTLHKDAFYPQSHLVSHLHTQSPPSSSHWFNHITYGFCVNF